MVHRYVNKKDVNGFKGELIILSDGDADIIDNKTVRRLENAKDYIIGFYEDDITIDTKKDVLEEYQSIKDEGDNISFKEWMMSREILFIIVKDT
jgi:hypothetical protein